MLPRQPAWTTLAVGFEHDREVGFAQALFAVEQRGERRLRRRQLLAPEQHVADIERARRLRQRELEHHGDAALHVARAKPHDALLIEVTRPVLLCRNRVEMAGKQHEGALAAARGAGQHACVAGVAHRHATLPQLSHDMLGDVSLCAGLGGDVDQLERALDEAGGEGR